jgi:hypothetical protein
MRQTIIKGLFYTVVALAVISCKSENAVDSEQSAVVSVKGQVLYRSDLDKAMPFGLSGEDSVAFTDAYIKKWAEDQLLYDKAVQNVIDEDKIKSLVEDYRKSLIVHSYKERVLEEYLSDNVTDSELMAFYEENKYLFKLKENIIKGLYLKVPLKSPELNNFRKWYTQATDNAIENIEKRQLQNAIGYEYFYDRWVSFESVIENIPYLVPNAEQFLKSRKSFETQDSSFVYLLNIKEYKLVGDEAPFDYEKSELTKLFMKRKEADYLNKIKEDLYQKAVSDKDIVFYNKPE